MWSDAGRFKALTPAVQVLHAQTNPHVRWMRLIGAVPASDVDVTLAILPPHVDAPWIAAHLTVLYQRALDVRLDVDSRRFPAVRTLDREIVFHGIERGARIAPTARVGVNRPA